MPHPVDQLWQRAVSHCYTEGGVPLQVFYELLRAATREAALEEAAREVEGLAFCTAHYAAVRIRRLKER